MSSVAANRPFVDRRVVDTDAARRAAIASTTRWELPEPNVLRTGMNAIFAAGDRIVRVGRATAPAARSHELAAALLRRGTPALAPCTGMAADVDGFAVTVWQRIEPVERPVDWEAVGAAVALVHTLERGDVPVGYPMPSPTAFPWWHFDELFDEIRPAIDEPAAAGLSAAIERNRGWVDTVRSSPVVCHGDVHPGNVLMTDAGPVLIDWDLLCTAPAGWDHAMLVTYAERWGGDAGVYRAFSSGYGCSLADDPATRQFGELRNVAATLMRVRAGLTDPSARTEAQRRLRFWRGDPAAPVWRAQ